MTEEEALLMTSLNNSGLSPFCMEISLKNGGKRTSDHLDVRSNILSKWLVRIWLTFGVKTSVVESVTACN